MKRFLSLSLCLAAFAFGAKETPKESEPFTPKLYISVSDFQTVVDSMVPKASFGMSVRSFRTGAEIAGFHADSFFTPASTLKTLTTAAALDFLPLNFQAKTSAHLEGSVSGKSFYGVIRLRGEGDPNISARFFFDPFYPLKVLADSIKAFGIDSLHVRFELDTSYYSGPRKPEHWRSNYYDSWYGAEVTPLIFNDNCALLQIVPGEKAGDAAQVTIDPDLGYVQVKNSLKTVKGSRKKWVYSLDFEQPIVEISGTVGVRAGASGIAIPVRNPALYFRAAFLKALRDVGLDVFEDPSAVRGIEIRAFEFLGTPLLSFLDEINQRSQNLHAEALFRNFAAMKYGLGNVENGRKGVEDFLRKWGIPVGGFELYDGCGLSPKNKVKPSAETELLLKMAHHPKGKFYVKSFASPGVGSGSKRFANLEFGHMLKFKTGFINETHALVGYMPTIDGDTLAIATYLNQTGKVPDNTNRAALDSIWSVLFRMVNAGLPSLFEMKQLYLEATSIGALSDRVKFFSEKFLGRPYLLGPTGEGYLDTIEPKVLVKTDSLDCVTFIEHVLALAKSPNEDSLFSTLMKIRYKDGKVAYTARKHYFVLDFLNEGLFAQQISLPADTTVVRTISKKAFFGAKKIPFDGEDSKLYLRYLPFDRALEFSKERWQGQSSVRGIGFVSRLENLDTFHTGFLLLDRGQKPVLRDASYKFGKVLDHSLEEYLESWKESKKVPGILLFEFK